MLWTIAVILGGIMATWYSHFIYPGRVNTYFSRCCLNCCVYKLNFWEEALNLTNVELKTIFERIILTINDENIN